MLKTIKFKDLQVGDIFPEDMSRVISLGEWQEVPCYELINKDGIGLVVSENHLIAMSDKNFEEIKEKIASMNSTLESKDQVSDKSLNWLAAKDIFNNRDRLVMETLEGMEFSIKEYKGLEPQRVRCITTDKGTFKINGFLNHNTARGSHSLDSMKDIVANLINVAGMSEEWVAKNLFLDLESVKRMTQLSGLKQAYDNIDAADLSWNPFEDESYERKTTSYLNREAAKYVQNYLKTHPDANNQARDMGDIITYAESLGWNKSAAEAVFQGK